MRASIASFALAFTLAGAALPAAANDSSAVLGAGGLELVPSGAIELQSEDLAVSPTSVSVHYKFMNRMETDVTTLVAFPLPDITMSMLEYEPVDIPNMESDNFVDFVLTVDGKAIEPQVEHRVLAVGIDRTDMLTGDGIPLSPFAPDLKEKLQALPEERIDEYQRIGMIDRFDDEIVAHWTVKTTFYWEQTFPAGRVIEVDHTYKPVIGSSFFYPESAADEPYFANFCMDDDFVKSAKQRIDERGFLMARELKYILTTASNWAGSIGHFHLTVDKSDPEWLVSLCADGIKKTGPTTFELEADDYLPDSELEVLFLEKLPPEPAQ